MKLNNKKYMHKVAENIMGDTVSNFVRFRKGYINHNYSFTFKEEKYMMKVPQVHVSNWKSEAKAYSHFFKGVKTDRPYGIVVRPWIGGEIVKVWDVRKLKSLQTQINKLQRSAIKGIQKHDWLSYDKHSQALEIKDYTYFKKLVARYSKDKKVFSHNDINGENVLWDGKRIHLIDFEWCSMNSEYFDAASFYISSGMKLKTRNEPKFDRYIFMTLCYFIMWTYDMQSSSKVKKLRKHYYKLLKKKTWLL